MDHARQVAEGGGDGRDVVGGHLASPGRGADLGLGGYLPGLGLGDPRADNGRVSPGLEAFPVLADLGVAPGDPRAGRFGPGECCGVLELGRPLGELAQRRVDAFRAEQFPYPVIDMTEHVGLPEVDVLRVVNFVRQRVLGGVPAQVVRLIVVPLPAHPAIAQAAQQDAAQRVAVLPAVLPVLGLAATPGERRLGVLEVFPADDRRVGDLLGEDPLVRRVPPLLCRVAECDVLDVDQDFIGALAVPHLITGVARVGEDRADGTLGPCDAGPVGVARRVMCGRAGDAVPCQAFGDGEDPAAGDELGEDPPDDRGRPGIEVQLVHPLAVRCLGRVGVRPRVHEHVPVWRASAEEPALDLGLHGHRGADTDLDPVALALAHAAEHRHDQVVRLVVRVDGAADLRHPQRNAVVVEDREREPVLVAVERPVRLADHHGVELSAGVLEFGEQRGCLRASLPRDRA